MQKKLLWIVMGMGLFINFNIDNQAFANNNINNNKISLNEVSGMINPAKHPDFIKLNPNLSYKTEYLRKNVAQDVQKMIVAAQKDGVRLRVLSGFRSFEHQKSIWERKWRTFSGSDEYRAQRVLKYSTPPAFSRHHWGTDVDFNSLKLVYWASADGQKTLNWLRKNAAKFGFCEVYSHNRTHGHAGETWHWSHLRSAMPFYQMRLANLNQGLKLNISGHSALNAGVLRPYVTSIKSCF